MPDLLVLAHVLSQDNPWIPLLTVAGIAVLVVFVLVATGRVTVEQPGDLLLPLASVVLVAGLAGSVASADWLLDQGPWIVPAAIVLLIALVLAATVADVRLGPDAVRATGVVTILAVVVAVAAFTPLDDAWFGGEADVFAVDRGDATVEMRLVEPIDDDGRLVVEITLDGGTIGDNVPAGTRPDDPEREMFVRFLLNGQPRFPAVPDQCASDPDCTTARFELLHTGDEPLERVTVELLTADQVPFTSPLSATLEGDELTGT